MLAPDYYIPKLPPDETTRQEYLDYLYTHLVELNTIERHRAHGQREATTGRLCWSEKLESQPKDDRGKTSKSYIGLVARDGWRHLNDNEWTVLFSEPLGQQRSQERPPIANW